MTYAGCHGLEILHPDGQLYKHDIPEDYQKRLKDLQEDLVQNVQVDGAWVEHKDLLVAWHYRLTSYYKKLLNN